MERIDHRHPGGGRPRSKPGSSAAASSRPSTRSISRCGASNVDGLDGNLGATTTKTGGTVLQLGNLHGDITLQLPLDTTVTPTVLNSDEYGNPHTGQATTPRYSWVGGKQRSSETPTGLTLMGMHLYDPTAGRFLSVDPIRGGNANAYDYIQADPLNQYDPDGKICWSCGFKAVGRAAWKYSAGVKKAPLAQKDTISVMFCTDMPDAEGRTVYGVTLRSYAVKDGKLVAERSSVLPSRFRPTSGCKGDGPGMAAQYAFSKDLTMLAGLSKDSRAAAVDTSTGVEIAPPDPDAFGKDLKSNAAVFHPVTSQLWYTSDPENYGVSLPRYFRDPKGGAGTQQMVPYAQLASHMAKDRETATTVLAADKDDSPVSPSGVVAQASTREGLGLFRVSPGSEGLLKEIKSPALRAPGALPGDTGTREYCDPAFWRDDTTLVCRHDSLEQLTFSADYQRVTKSENLLPESDRRTGIPTPSPDGKGFVFLSETDSDQWVLYRGDFATPGAQPVKIAELEQPLDGAGDHRVSLIRWS
ncbi:RHS repeat-associated core domain-containing protein [Streptomyces sp. ISL-66]|uniref:RHS repeat-associated core domain-containing protein n=1 Tax=Streptomyces sp. ISL-66 TaxID=2819186 RepID=UPI0035AE848A